MSIKVRFWGVRGSIACPAATHIRYGGNTSCIEVILGERRIILDAGTGIRDLGHAFLRHDIREAHILLTHTHWDHINGFPFFAPAYDPRRSLHIMAGHLSGEDNIRSVLASQMSNPMFPVPLEAMRAELRIEDFRAGDSFDLFPDVRVRTVLLRHPNGATGYRVEYGGHAVCYITDTEHVPEQMDQGILGLIEGADAVIYDCSYTEEEFPKRIGWGHSTWNEGIRLCRAANVRQMLIFHHDPDHDDLFMEKLEAEAREVWTPVMAAREGMILTYE